MGFLRTMASRIFKKGMASQIDDSGFTLSDVVQALSGINYDAFLDGVDESSSKDISIKGKSICINPEMPNLVKTTEDFLQKKESTFVNNLKKIKEEKENGSYSPKDIRLNDILGKVEKRYSIANDSVNTLIHSNGRQEVKPPYKAAINTGIKPEIKVEDDMELDDDDFEL